MLDLSAKNLNEVEVLNKLTLFEIKIKFIFCLFYSLKSSKKRKLIINSNKKTILIFFKIKIDPKEEYISRNHYFIKI
jgi:hypothetical protein